MLFTNNCYYFDFKNSTCNYSSFPAHRSKSVDQVPLPLVIGLDDNWDTKGSHGPVFSSQSGAGSEKTIVPLNSASISV